MANVKNTFDINHVFTLDDTNGDTIYLPFRNIDYVEDEHDAINVYTKSGRKIIYNCEEAYYFMMEYKGCVGLPFDGDE